MFSLVLVNKLLEKLKSISPAQTDVEFRTLAPDAGGDIELLSSIMKFFIQLLKGGKDYELTQAYISLFLKVSVVYLKLFKLKLLF